MDAIGARTLCRRAWGLAAAAVFVVVTSGASGGCGRWYRKAIPSRKPPTRPPRCAKESTSGRMPTARFIRMVSNK
jgi:hypothetical protein